MSFKKFLDCTFDLLVDYSLSFIKIFVISTLLFFFWLEVFAGVYKDISSDICSEYSIITKNETKYFGFVGCYKKIDNNWVKIN